MLTPSERRAIDRQNMFALLTGFPEQCRRACDIARSAELPAAAPSFDHIVVTGMGGSAVGGELLGGHLAGDIEIPVLVNRDYVLPRFVNRRSLVLACSYSGDTEETLSAVNSIDGRRATVICIGSGGRLAQLASENGYAHIKVPGGQPPRTALGYLFIPLLITLERFGLIDARSDLEETLEDLETRVRTLSRIEQEDNPARRLAQQLVKRVPLVYGSREPNAALPTRWRNQFSENAKVLAFSNLLPELNHNEIVGWSESSSILDQAHVVLLRDRDEIARVKARFDISREIIERHSVPCSECRSEGGSRLCRTFSLIVLADFTSYILALLNRQDPTPIENIDILKRKLERLT